MASPGSPESIGLLSSFRHPERLGGKRGKIELIGQISHDGMRRQKYLLPFLCCEWNTQQEFNAKSVKMAERCCVVLLFLC
jgi:hypothetical protein